MARPWRIQFAGANYHVMARGNEGRDIFLGPGDREDLLALIGRMSSRFKVDIFAFCLMSNHYHLFLGTREANLASAMHWLNGAYTGRFNRRHSRIGHLLQGRYKSVVVAEPSHWLHLSAYIHLNPVRSGMVDDPGRYEWSSFRDYTRAQSRYGWLKTERILAAYGSGVDEAARRRRYRKHLLALAGRPPSVWEELRTAVFLGTAKRWEQLKKKYPPSGRQDAVAEFNLRPGRPVVIEEEVARVAKVFGVTAEDILAGRRKDFSRSALYYHLVEHCGLTGARAAEVTGVSEMAVSLACRLIRAQMGELELLRKRIAELERKL